MLASETRRLAREALAGKWGKAALIFLFYIIITIGLNFILAFIPFVGSIATYVLQIPLSFGLTATLIKLKRGEETTYTEFLNNGFSNFAESWKVTIWTWIKMLAPIILGVVCGFVLIAGISVGIATAAEAKGLTIPATMTSDQLAVLIKTHNLTSSFGPTANMLILLGFFGMIVASIWLTVKSYLYKTTFFMLFDNPDKNAKEIVEESADMMKGNRWKFFCLELSFIGWAILASFTFGIGFLWLMPYITIAQVCFYETLVGKNNNSTSE